MRYVFQEVRRSAIKDGACPVCGVKTTRQQKFYQTISPFNKNAAGDMKTADEIVVELKAEMAAWTPDFTHGKCKAA